LKSYWLNAVTSNSMEHSDQLQGKANKASYSQVDFASADVFKSANRLVLRLYLPSLGVGLFLYSTAQFHPNERIYIHTQFLVQQEQVKMIGTLRHSL